jgi:PII-like signaling protein
MSDNISRYVLAANPGMGRLRNELFELTEVVRTRFFAPIVLHTDNPEVGPNVGNEVLVRLLDHVLRETMRLTPDEVVAVYKAFAGPEDSSGRRESIFDLRSDLPLRVEKTEDRKACIRFLDILQEATDAMVRTIFDAEAYLTRNYPEVRRKMNERIMLSAGGQA